MTPIEAIPGWQGPVPEVDADQMIEVDRAMIEDYGIELIQMMENAGRNLAQLARVRFLDGDPRGKSVVVLAGTGGNGGGAMVCARRLHGWGADVIAVFTKPTDVLEGVPARQLRILEQIGVTLAVGAVGDGEEQSWADPALVVDGIIGYSLRGAPAGGAAALIELANTTPAPVLSLDSPSGFDAATGEFLEPAVRATATMTLALPKRGLRAAGAARFVGELYLADISVPPDLYRSERLGFEFESIFAASDIVRLGGPAGTG